MHDGILTDLEDAKVFLMMSFFIFTLQGQYIVNSSILVLLSGLVTLFFLGTWGLWELYVVGGVALLIGKLLHITSHNKWRKCNKVELAYFLVGQPFYLCFLTPIIIPQTNAAVGVLLAGMVWMLIIFFFSIFYVKNSRLLDSYMLIPIASMFILTLFFHHYMWVPFAVASPLAVLASIFFFKRFAAEV